MFNRVAEIKIKMNDCVEIKSNTAGKSRGVKIYSGTVMYTELIGKLNDYLEANPREPNLNPKASRAISGMNETIINESDLFVVKNNGLLITAKNVKGDIREYGKIFKNFNYCDRYGYNVTLEIEDKTVEGLLNGAHTYLNLEKNRLQDVDITNVEIPVKIITKGSLTNAELTRISRSVNTSVDLQEISEFNKLGKLDAIKEYLCDEPYFKYIAFKENEYSEDLLDDKLILATAPKKSTSKLKLTDIDKIVLGGERKPIMATDVAKLAYMFDIKVFDDGGSGQKNPTRAYVRKHDVYAEYLIADENEETFKTICKNMLKTIIDLYSIIQITMPTAYGSGFGKLKMVKIGQKPLYYKQQILPYKVPEGITLILLAGFRVCCDFDSNNEIYFKYDPIKLYSIIKDDIVKEAIKFIQSNQKEGTKTTETQRNEMWRVMALSVSNKLLKLERSGIIKPVVNKNNLLTFEDYMKNN